MQNETNAIEDIINNAKQKGLKVCFNPAPMTQSVKSLPLEKIDLLIVNEVEAEALTGEALMSDVESWFKTNIPDTEVIITLGSKGAKLVTKNGEHFAAAFKVKAIDTTAAGDTFIGFFLSAYVENQDPELCIRKACAASAIAVTRIGAAQSIPTAAEVDTFLAEQN